MEINVNQLIEVYGRISHINYYHIFIIAVVVDILISCTKADVIKDLDSKVGLKGILKHLPIVGLVFLVCPYVWLLGYGGVAVFLIYSITLTYGINIVENYDAIRPRTLPPWLGQFFRRTKNDLDHIDIEKIKRMKLKWNLCTDQ